MSRFLWFLNSVIEWLQSQHELKCFDIHQTVHVALFMQQLKSRFNQEPKWFPLFITEGSLDEFDKSRKRYAILTYKRMISMILLIYFI